MHATFNNQCVTNNNIKKMSVREFGFDLFEFQRERKVVSYIVRLLTLLTQYAVAQYTLCNNSTRRCDALANTALISDLSHYLYLLIKREREKRESDREIERVDKIEKERERVDKIEKERERVDKIEREIKRESD